LPDPRALGSRTPGLGAAGLPDCTAGPGPGLGLKSDQSLIEQLMAEGSGSWRLIDHIPPPQPGEQRNRVASVATMAMIAYLGSATDVELFQIMHEASSTRGGLDRLMASIPKSGFDSRSTAASAALAYRIRVMRRLFDNERPSGSNPTGRGPTTRSRYQSGNRHDFHNGYQPLPQFPGLWLGPWASPGLRAYWQPTHSRQ
jgi:hypothetical protein